VSLYDTLNSISLYEILAATGALCEIAGFVWVVAEVSRTLSEDYGEAGVFRRIGRRIKIGLRYVFEEPPKRVSFSSSMAGTATLSSGASLEVSARRKNETEIQRLTRELAELRADVEQQKKAVQNQFAGVDQRITDVQQSIRETAESLSQRAYAIEQHLRAIHATSLRKEKGGARLFILGAVLTLIAALI
jgi:hypothetical protein